MKTYGGKLIYNDFGDYELLFKDGYKEGIINISELLNKIYYSDNNHIDITISTSTPQGLRIICNENGNLIRRKMDDLSLYSYYINGTDIETLLFNKVDSYIEVEIKAKALEGEQHGKRQMCAI